MWLDVLQNIMLALCGGVIVNWISGWTGDPARRAMRLGASSLANFWTEMRIGMAARRLKRLLKIRENPARALGDMIMALAVVLMGGGYGLLIVIMILYKQINHQPIGQDAFSLLGPASLILMGFHRLTEASAELAQTEKMIDALRRRATSRQWDLDDAMVGLR